MSNDQGPITRVPEDSVSLWFGFLAGPIFWSAHLLLSYALVPVACSTGWHFLLYLVTVATALGSAAGAFVSWRILRDHRASRDAGQRDVRGRTHFMALSGVIGGIFFAAVSLFEGLPILFLDPCIWAA